jgi:hypothetical protein
MVENLISCAVFELQMMKNGQKKHNFLNSKNCKNYIFSKENLITMGKILIFSCLHTIKFPSEPLRHRNTQRGQTLVA